MARKNYRGGGQIKCFFDHHIFAKIISLENLFLAWKEFKKGKNNKKDVAIFNFYLENNILDLHYSLKNKTYQHKPYKSFYVCDPKLRLINKAEIVDRVVHQAIFRILYYIFDKKFIYNSCSCRFKKGVHFGINRLKKILIQASYNNKRKIYILKCDIKKFFASIDKNILIEIIKRNVFDKEALWLLKIIINSFDDNLDKGLPLGNVTSQLFANIYLNELDQFIKHKLKIKYYIRYTDDFLVISSDKNYLLAQLNEIQIFLKEKLKLDIHPNKIIIRKYISGIDFLGYAHFPYYRALRTKTKKRIIRKLKKRNYEYQKGKINFGSLNQSLQSIIGLLKHCSGYKIKRDLRKINRSMFLS